LAQTSGSTLRRIIELWYGEPHQAPDLLGAFVYGIPEINRERIRGAKAVAAAGCYPDIGHPGAEAAGGRRRDRSGHHHRRCRLGVSGAGKALKEATHFNAWRRISAPTGCSTTATPPRWRWRWAAACCSPRIWRR
jgi:N-acetyl-gamma-glutamylphosphate reductase